MLTALILFAATYVLLLIFQKWRHWIALISACLYVILGIMPVSEIAGAIDFNVLLMIAGTMGLVALFIDSNMPAVLADLLVEHIPTVKWVVVALALFAGIVSAFVDNVATVLMVAPVAITLARRFDLNPVPIVIAIAVSSNLQGAATLVGDTTAILLGGYAGMNFFDFFVFHGRPGMFFVVEIGAALSALVLLWKFRSYTQKVSLTERSICLDYFPSVLLILLLVLLIGASFIPNKPDITNGVLCMCLFAIGLARHHRLDMVKRYLKRIDYETLLLLLGLFVIVGGITQAGVIDAISALFLKAGSSNTFVIYTLIVWASVLISAFVDNIPYTATMLPVVQGIATSLGIEPYLLYFGLLTGATLGGNLTPVGASANVTGIGILRREGYEVTTGDFLKIGVPFSLVAVITGYILLWVIWS